MKKYLFPFIFTSLLLANPTDKTPKLTPIYDDFVIESKSEIFDNSISYTHKPLLKCTPQISAVYKVESEMKLKVIPKTPLRSGTEYSCDYGEENFKFTTEPLRIDDARYFKGQKILRLSFSDEVDKKSLSDGLVLEKLDRLSTTNLKYKVLQSNGKDMVLEISEAVNNSTIVLKLTKKITTAHGSTLEKVFEKRFNESSAPVVLDKELKELNITDAPRMISLDGGGFALRLFLDDSFNSKSDKYIEIEGIENFTVNPDNYISRHYRKEFNISNEPYYYTDIKSPDFKPNTSYKVTLKKGLRTYRELKEDKHYSVKTGDRSRGIVFEGEKTYVSNAGDFGFLTTNIDSATLVVERLLDDNLRYFLNFEEANKYRVGSYLKEVFSKKLILNNQKNEIVKQKFSFKSLDKKLPFGVYKITFRYSEMVNKKEKERAASKVIFLSDLGISVNLAKKQAFVTVLSLSTAKPMANASIELYAKNNDLIGTAITNSDGVAIIEGENLSSKNLLDGDTKGVVVKTKEDTNFLLLYRNNIDTPSPRYILKKPERFQAHIYFQSKILRPASKINALVTVKDRDFISAKKLPIKLTLINPSGDKVYSKVYHTDNYGLIDFSYQLDENDKTGEYTLVAEIGDNTLGYKKFKVEAFMPPKIENSISTDKNIYKNSELIELNISSSYLFGSPSSELQGSVKLNARAVDFYHKDYKSFTFSNNELSRGNVKSYIDRSDSFTLDEKGKATLFLSSKVTQKVPSVLDAMIGVTVMDDTQPVSTYKKIKIYPYKAMVGLHINKTSFEKGQKLKGKAVLIDPFSGKIVDRKLYAVVKKVNWQYTYSNGEYNWQKEIKRVGSFNLSSNEEFSYDIDTNGDYIVEVHDYFGGHSSSASFDVWWWGYSNISPKNDLKSVEIKFEDKLYKKGDTIEVSIKSPILEGEVFITLESDKIELYRRITLHKGVGKVSIPIEVDMGRGVFIHATAIRASDTPSKLIPFRAMGYELVKADRDEHRIKVKIDAPQVSKSKTSLSFNVKTSKPSKLLISIVDRGILQLVEQKKPNLFDYFNAKSTKKLSYYDLYDQLMSFVVEGTLIDFGAGDMLNKRKHLAPDLGKRIKPFMIWSGIVDVVNRDKNITIDIPEFNGRASIVAIAINADSVGVDEKDIEIKDDIMLKPSYPKYTLVGDNIEVPLRVFNTTKEVKTVTISSTLSDNLSFVLKEKNITIPPNSSKLLTASLVAKKVGKGEILLTAQYGNEKITKSVELPIYSPYAISTHTFKGISNQTKEFTPPKEYANARVIITLSDNLIGALRDDLKYLVRYPHGCAEQTSSKLSAMHYAKPFLQKDELVRESKNFIRQGVKKLQNMQNYYGEFNYWEGGDYVHSYASLYASQILLELKRDGVEMRDSFVRKIVKMLDSVSSANGSYTARYSNFQRVYAAFILAEHKALSQSTSNMLYEKKMYRDNLLSKLYMSAILKMQGKTEIADKLYKESSFSLKNYATQSYKKLGNFGSNNRDMFLHFMIKSAYFERDVNDLVIVQKEFSNLYSTQSKAVALKAISTYLGKPKSSKLYVNININGQNDNYTKSTTIGIDKLSSDKITLTPKNSSMSYSIELIENLPKEIKNKISSTNELSIEREFINEDGKNIDIQNLIQGEKIYSKVKIVNYGEIKNVVVSQRVPACLSIVNNNINNQKAKYKDINIDQEYREIRDDRVLNFINLAKKEKYSKEVKRTITIANQGVIYTPFMITTKGECRLPAIITEAMYDTRINDYAKEADKIVVYEANSTTKTTQILKKESFENRAKALVLSLYKKEMSSTNPDEFMEFFSYPVAKYYREKDASKEFVKKDKANYFRDWSKRSYSNMKVELMSSIGDEVAKVKIVFDYVIDNGKKELKGVSRHLLSVKEVGGRILIVGVEVFL